MFFLLKIFLYSLIYLFMTVLSLRCCASFSVVLVSRSYSLVAALVAIWELIIVVASLVRCRARRREPGFSMGARRGRLKEGAWPGARVGGVARRGGVAVPSAHLPAPLQL